MKTIDIDQFVRETVRMAISNRDTTYAKEEEGGDCSYSRGVCSNGAAGCLFGQVLANLGIEPSSLPDSRTIACLLKNEIAFTVDWNDRDKGEDRERIVRWAYRMQVEQDRGESWGRCLDVANLATILTAHRNSAGITAPSITLP